MDENKVSSVVDTIVAPATPPGRSALAVVRMSGPLSFDIVSRLCLPLNPEAADTEWKPWRLRNVSFCDPDSRTEIDLGMAVWMRAPRSYTGEDAAELTCHGSPLLVEAIVRACISLGARLADPGEFTRRAFLNDKINLVEAEAVSDLIAAETQASAETARRQLVGDLSPKLVHIRETLLDTASEIEARIDFPEEEIPAPDKARLLRNLKEASARIGELLKQGARGRRMREGARAAIVGRVNAGKSSLFNALVGSERAIATPHPGTTRDTIEARIDLKGLPLDLVDTAGLRETPDEVESIGIERSKREIERADVVICVVDAQAYLDSPTSAVTGDGATDSMLATRVSILAFNKYDLVPRVSPDMTNRSFFGSLSKTIPASNRLMVSAKTGAGLAELEDRIFRVLTGSSLSTEGSALVSNVRHIEALEAAAKHLSDSERAMESAQSLEFVMVDLRGAIDRIGELLGLETGEEILDRIFKKFCLGK